MNRIDIPIIDRFRTIADGKPYVIISDGNIPAMERRLSGTWQGQEAYKDLYMKVLRDVDVTLRIPEDVNQLIDITKPDLPWAEAHFQERIGGYPLNPGESYKIWPYANFDKNKEFQKDEQFDHSYMERFWPKYANEDEVRRPYAQHINQNRGIRFELGDYNDVLKQLTDNPLTRQAYLPIFFPEDTGAKDNMRVPCTLGYLFEIWDNKLDITYYIRSCDVFRHFRNDVYMAARLLQHTRTLLLTNGIENLECGKLKMKIANLHLFENDQYAFNKKEKKIQE